MFSLRFGSVVFKLVVSLMQMQLHICIQQSDTLVFELGFRCLHKMPNGILAQALLSARVLAGENKPVRSAVQDR